MTFQPPPYFLFFPSQYRSLLEEKSTLHLSPSHSLLIWLFPRLFSIISKEPRDSLLIKSWVLYVCIKILLGFIPWICHRHSSSSCPKRTCHPPNTIPTNTNLLFLLHSVLLNGTIILPTSSKVFLNSSGSHTSPEAISFPSQWLLCISAVMTTSVVNTFLIHCRLLQYFDGSMGNSAQSPVVPLHAPSTNTELQI